MLPLPAISRRPMARTSSGFGRKRASSRTPLSETTLQHARQSIRWSGRQGEMGGPEDRVRERGDGRRRVRRLQEQAHRPGAAVLEADAKT